jgi:hypothetical protein
MDTSAIEDAEAMGTIKRGQHLKIEAKVAKDTSDLQKVYDIENPHEFEMAIARAKMKPGVHLLVTPELMEYLLRGAKDASIVYQNVRCYIAGSKDELDMEESMSAEASHDYKVKKKMGIL